MQISINISEEGKVTAEIQGAKPIGESVVYSSPGPGEYTFPIGEGQAYDAGSAPMTLESGLRAPETKPTTELGGLDAGRAPQS